MGDPRKIKKHYSRPIKMWDRNRLDAEKPIISEFGLKNKKELWKMSAALKKYAHQAKRLIASRTQQSEIEKKQVVTRLASLGIVGASASIDDVLGLTMNDFLARRLQALVLKRSLARSTKQARQFIVHRHIRVGDKIITSPSYLVPIADEPQISFVEGSSLSNPEHPERAPKKAGSPGEAKESKEEVAADANKEGSN